MKSPEMVRFVVLIVILALYFSLNISDKQFLKSFENFYNDFKIVSFSAFYDVTLLSSQVYIKLILF